MCPLCEKIAIALARFTSCWGGHLQVSARSPKAKVYLLECDSFSFQKALKDRSDWVQAIQTNLTLAFSGARETSSTAAAAAANAPAAQPSADAAAESFRQQLSAATAAANANAGGIANAFAAAAGVASLVPWIGATRAAAGVAGT